MSEINHVVLTRFNLPTQGVESLIRAREGWLRDRVELFERYCVPSLAAQTRPDFDWLVYLDPESPAWLVERIRVLASDGLFRPVYRATIDKDELVQDIRDTVRPRGDVLITTNLDNDDALAADALERIASVCSGEPRAVVYLSRGLVKSSSGVYLQKDPSNAFVSVRESWDSPVTSWSEYHNEFPRVMPAHRLGGSPGWLQVVHGANVSNRVRGRLVAPQAYQVLFGHLLDDVPEPDRRQISLDRVLRHPARVARDSGRAFARRSALAVLGKERYGQVKERIARVRRRRT